jgi:hypothetical protein
MRDDLRDPSQRSWHLRTAAKWGHFESPWPDSAASALGLHSANLRAALVRPFCDRSCSAEARRERELGIQVAALA